MLFRSNINLLLCGLSLLLACESSLDVPLPPHEPRLVINAFLNPEEAPEIYLSQSISKADLPLGNFLIPNAQLSLWQDGQKRGDFVYRDTIVEQMRPNGTPFEETLGKYELVGVQVAPGQTYEVRGEHPDFPDIRAETYIPSEVVMEDFRFRPEVSRRFDERSGQFEFENLIEFRFQDPPEQNSYYLELDVYYDSPVIPGDTANYRSIGITLATDSIDAGLSTTSFGQLLRDSVRNGEQIEAQYRFLTYATESDQRTWTGQEEIYFMELRLLNFNEATYQYLAKMALQSQLAGQDAFDLFPPESINVPSNVEGGYGILGGMSVTRQRFDF
ncbi:MAG: DUF4249 domain-containing protein [Bacteroidota bacterium]